MDSALGPLAVWLELALPGHPALEKPLSKKGHMQTWRTVPAKHPLTGERPPGPWGLAPGLTVEAADMTEQRRAVQWCRLHHRHGHHAATGGHCCFKP